MPTKFSNEQILQIHRLRDDGCNKKQVQRELNIDYCTVRLYWEYDLSQHQARSTSSASLLSQSIIDSSVLTLPTTLIQHYAFLLGCYFGDGYINKQGPYTWKIRFSLDTKYPYIINEVLSSLRSLYDSGFVVSIKNSNSVDVSAHSYLLPQHFPHLGVGTKHERDMQLQSWQNDIIAVCPWEFIKGLYYTDGSRYLQSNRYLKYNFTNRSRDIIDMFAATCDLVGINYYINPRPFKNMIGNISVGWTLTVGRKYDVTIMDQHLGSKQ